MTVTMKFLILVVGVLCSFTPIKGMPSPAKAEQAVEEVDLADRIVGGTATDRNKHPYIVSLKDKVDTSLCQGTSTSATAAATAASTAATTTEYNWDDNDWDGNDWDDNDWDGNDWDDNDWDDNDWDGNDWDGNDWDGNDWDGNDWNDDYWNYYYGNGKRAMRDDGHFCGAALVSATHLVTAAHCVTTGSCYKVVINEENRNSQNGNIVLYAMAKQHENYNSGSMENDIAVMTLKTAVDHINDVKIDPIPLATSTPLDGTACTVAGWGTTTEDGFTSNTLLDVEVPIVSKATCQQNYGNGSISDGMICAGLSAGGKDSCQGDSGGPFVCKENGQKVLSGVVSWGYGCAQPGYPGVYTDVSKYRNWIQNNT